MSTGFGITIAQPQLVSVFLAVLLMLLASIDFVSFRLPNALNLLLGLSGLLVAGLQSTPMLSERVLGIFLGAAVLAITAALYRRIKNAQGLGGGDTKLLAAAGAWVSWQGIPTVLMIGASSAALYGIALAMLAGRNPRTERVPFGTFLCIGIWITWLNGPFVV